MAQPDRSSFTTPREGELGLRRLANAAGLSISLLPNGTLFAIEHERDGRRVMINQLLASPLQGGIGRLVLRLGGSAPRNVEIMGPAAQVKVGAGGDRFVWAGASEDIRHAVTLWLDPRRPVWLWHVELSSEREVPCDLILVQDVGLAERPFLMANQAFASQYIDHHIERHDGIGPVVMCRQNLEQAGRHPWLMQGCLDGVASFATDCLQVFGPSFRDAAEITRAFGTDLPGERLQHEAACVALQSRAVTLRPGTPAIFTFFALVEADHAEASDAADLARLDLVRQALADFGGAEVKLAAPPRSLLQGAAPVVAHALGDGEIARLFPDRRHEELRGGRLLSFFVPDGTHNRHVVLRDKERQVPRRHGNLMRSGGSMLPDNRTLCATVWMHGVFAAQLTIGNTTFHKLFSVAAEPYNIMRASGLRILVELDGAWRLLTVPSAFEMGLSDARWLYRLDDRSIAVHAVVAGDQAAMQWRIEVTGEPCRFLVLGHLAMGEHELENTGRVTIDRDARRIAFRPDPSSLWGQRCPAAVHHLVTATPRALDKIGGDELLYADGEAHGGPFIALSTHRTHAFAFALVGSMTDAEEGERLARLYESDVSSETMLEPARRFWTHVGRDIALRTNGDARAKDRLSAIETILPWLAHNAMMHLSVPHGLEQYIGAAWGTRDACQGPVELLLSLEHDAEVKEILRIVFSRQFAQSGDFPGWFMHAPYADMAARGAPGDVLIWPLKALCDYAEATDDLAFLDEPVAWLRDEDLAATERRDPVSAHADKLIATVRERFIPGTNLVRYGDGDWNDSLQPADTSLRDKMVSSWTVALFLEQLGRYAQVLRCAGKGEAAAPLETLAAAMAADFRRHLMRDGVVAGYAVFEPGLASAELVLHPSDRRTGLRYSLLPMNRAIASGLFTPEEARRHLELMREHLVFPDGVRLMDRPIAYRGGTERLFRRAESSSFFGREIGLMYVHEHLRYGESLAVLGEAEALFEALEVVNPISVAELLAHASLRQRNAYFSSSDAAFRDRYEAMSDFAHLRDGKVAVDGGWRIYSSGPGLYTRLLLQKALGIRRHFGERIEAPLLPASLGAVTVELTIEGRRIRRELARPPDRE